MYVSCSLMLVLVFLRVTSQQNSTAWLFSFVFSSDLWRRFLKQQQQQQKQPKTAAATTASMSLILLNRQWSITWRLPLLRLSTKSTHTHTSKFQSSFIFLHFSWVLLSFLQSLERRLVRGLHLASVPSQLLRAAHQKPPINHTAKWLNWVLTFIFFSWRCCCCCLSKHSHTHIDGHVVSSKLGNRIKKEDNDDEKNSGHFFSWSDQTTHTHSRLT